MKYLFFISLLCISSLAFGQMTGRITYLEKFNLHINLPPEREHMKEMIPNYSTSYYDLTFKDKESIYATQKESLEASYSSTQGGNQMVMRFGRDMRVVYKNLETDEMIDSRDFMQKQFLIKGPPTTRKWKIGKNQKQILGYTCMEATFEKDTATFIRAWFTPQLAISNGPSDFQGLPGMILEVEVNDGERSTTAIKIDTENVDTSVIIPPTKGKQVTAEEFEKIREEKMKEMNMGGHSGGWQQITIRRH